MLLRFIVLSGFALLLLGPKAAAQATSSEASKAAVKAEEAAFAKAGKEKAPVRQAALWEEFLDRYPDSIRAESARRQLLLALFSRDPAAAETRQRKFESDLGGFRAAPGWHTLAIEYLKSGQQNELAEAAAGRAVAAHTMAAHLEDTARRTVASGRPPLQEERLRAAFRSTRIEMLETLGEARARLGKDARAEEALREALSLSPSAWKAALQLARLLDRRGAVEDALPLAAQSLLASGSGESREVFAGLFRRARQGDSDPESYLDSLYHSLFPPPIHPAKYEPTAGRTKRTALLEVYTGAGCPPCAAADLAFDAVLERYSRQEVAVVMFHQHIPRPDPISNDDSLGRWKWLNGQGVPTYAIDGKQMGGGGPRAYAPEMEQKIRPLLDQRLETPAGAEMTLQASAKGGVLHVRAEASSIQKPSGGTTLHLALVEKLIRYSGENGIRFHPMAVRAFASYRKPGAAGFVQEHEFDLNQVQSAVNRHLDEFEKRDERHNKDGKFRFQARPETIDRGNLAVVAWLQDDATREVAQAAWSDVPVSGGSADRSAPKITAQPSPAVTPSATSRQNPVAWALAAPARVAPGSALRATLTAAIQPGWHLYSLRPLEGGPIPTSMNLPEGQPFLLAGDIEAPPPLRKPDETFGMEVESYEGTVEFVLPLAAATSAAGAKTLTVAVRYQVCNDKLCLPPRTVRVAAPVELK